MSADDFLSFPPDTLIREPLRLPIVARGADWLVLNKAPGVPWSPDPWIPRQTDLVREVRRQLRDGKPQLARLGIGAFHGIVGPDLVASGAVLCAITDTEGTRLANALGSEQIELTYRFVTMGRPTQMEIVCDLPLAPHASEPRMLVSHTTGKKTLTTFRLEQRFRGYAVWTATSTFDRLHQIRLHAAESGLPIVGESRYAKAAPIFLSEIKRDYRPAGDGTRAEPPLYGELCLHLARLAFPAADGKPVVVEVPLPKPFGVLLKKLGEHLAV
jgi:23S rRNA-/tRNA-specific pseudouridylate synthase